MKSLAPLTVTVALVSGVSIATAASMSKSAAGNVSSSTPQLMAKDTLSLSPTQQQTAWKSISAQATKERAPASFTAKLGAAVPNSLATHPVPVSTANKVPTLQPYQYVLLNNNKLLIINPGDHKVAEIITHS